MAETKKKITAKKKPEVKKTSNANKQSKKVTKAVNKKVSSTKKVDNKTKKTEEKTQDKKTKPVSKKVNLKKEKTMKIITIVLAILFVILLIFTIYSQMNKDESEYVMILNTSDLMMNEDGISLTIIEDPSCEHCQVDLFASQIKDTIIPNLTVSKVSYDSAQGQQLLSAIESPSVPVFLFNKNLDQIENWTTLISQAFNEIKIEDKVTYMLKDELVQSKVVIEDIELPDGAVVLGNKDSSVTVIEFTDYGCPLCALSHGNEELLLEFANRIPAGYLSPVPEVMKNYVDTGKVKYVHLNVPNEVINPEIRTVHLAALCANDQDKFQVFNNKLFENRTSWGLSLNYSETMKQLAVELNLNEDEFNTCLDSKKFDSQINEEIALFDSLKFQDTPMFMVNKNLIAGPQDYRIFEFLIEEELTVK